jgi:hypothetical protein
MFFVFKQFAESAAQLQGRRANDSETNMVVSQSLEDYPGFSGTQIKEILR